MAISEVSVISTHCNLNDYAIEIKNSTYFSGMPIKCSVTEELKERERKREGERAA